MASARKQLKKDRREMERRASNGPAGQATPGTQGGVAAEPLPVLAGSESREARSIRFAVYLGAFLLVAWFANAAYYFVRTNMFSAEYPRNTYLFLPGETGGDFVQGYAHTQTFDPLHMVWVKRYGLPLLPSYPLFAYVLMIPFVVLPLFLGYCVHQLLFIGGAAAGCMHLLWTPKPYRFLLALLVPAILLTSYPFQFCLDRANEENLLILLIGGAVIGWLYYRHQLTALLVGMAAAAKLFPGFMVLLLVRRRAWGAFLAVPMWVVVLTGLALVIFRTGAVEAVQFFIASRSEGEAFALGPASLDHSCSLWSAVRSVMFVFDPNSVMTVAVARRAAGITVLFDMALLSVLTAAALFGRVRRWELLFLLVAGMLLCTIESGDYKLMYLYLPLLIFIRAPEPGRRGWFYLAAFALLLTSKRFVSLEPHPADPPFCPGGEVTANGLINVILMLGMSLEIVAQAVKRSKSAPTASEIEEPPLPLPGWAWLRRGQA
jgi:hypothetical protein